MKEYNFKKIDAFATEKSNGNPAGYILLDKLDDISENEKLQIAKELKGFVSEVGYVAQINKDEFDFRYYSSEKEVEFCGHATIAIMYDLVTTNSTLKNVPALKINTNKGQLMVENRIEKEDSVFIMSPAPVLYNSIPDIEILCQSLKIRKTELNTNYPISVVNAG